MSNGYQLAPHELTAQVSALAKLGDRADALVTSAGELAQRLPKLGTAPPALHLAQRLRAAAGETGLTGAMTARSAELARYHGNLATTLTRYISQEDKISRSLDAS